MKYTEDYKKAEDEYMGEDDYQYDDIDPKYEYNEKGHECSDECPPKYSSEYSPEYSSEYSPEYDEECSMKHKKMIEVEEVIGVGHGETVTEVCIPLCPPAFEVLDKLIEKKVVFDAIVAGKDKVFVNGRIIKDIPYKTKCESVPSGCENISKLTFGNVRHVTAEIPFVLCINVPGSVKGAKAVVLKYDVDSIEIQNHLGCIPNSCIAKCEPFALKHDTCQKRLFKSITEKDCIFVKVKVVKPVIIKVPYKYEEKC